MTDKVQKIRKEVEKLKSNLIHGACSSQVAMETMCKEEAYNEVLAILDSMQEEPVSIWHDASKKSDNPEDVVIINPSDNTGEVLTKCTGVNQGRIWAYTSELLKIDNPCNIGKDLQEPQVKESAEIQHVNETCKENGNSLTQELVNVWHDAQTEQPQAKEKILATNEYGDCEVDFAINMALYWKKVIKWAYIEDLLNLSNVQRTVKKWKEPISEELEEASKEWLVPQLDKSYANYGESKMMELTHFDGYAMLDAIEFGAQWQKKQMMAKAIEGGCFSYKNGFVHISCDIDENLTDIKMGDKVKVIVIKED